MLDDLLRKHGITVGRGFGPGVNHMTTCPQCSHLRKKKADRCLSVKVEDGALLWHCFHCDWKGHDSGETAQQQYPKHTARTRKAAAWRQQFRRIY